MNLEFIFKIIDKDEWQKAKQKGTYDGSDKDKKDNNNRHHHHVLQ